MVEWRIAQDLVQYPSAIQVMEDRVRAMLKQDADELIWFLEHPPLYTAGTSACDGELLRPHDLPVFRTGRGGRFTYHGPGQLVGYVLLDLKKRRPDVRWYVAELEAWIISVLAELGINAGTRDRRIGVWTANRVGEDAKIAAIGVRIKRWITYHGFSINITPNLGHFDGIIPCGISNYPVTSLEDLQITYSKEDIIDRFRQRFGDFFH
ncbi:MAG: lipoyl(octanoyl) transferase LipB [Pseudomonadota bacterium]